MGEGQSCEGKKMFVFIDESGDPGINSNNSLFVLASIKFITSNDAKKTDEAIENLKNNLSYNNFEFHFSKNSDFLKEQFFNNVTSSRFIINAVVVDKALIRNRFLKTEPRKFYNYFLRILLERTKLNDAKIVIDGRGQPAMKRSLKKYLNKHTSNQIRALMMEDSKKDNLLQLADMIAGAIARAHTQRSNRTDIWVKKLNLEPEHIWFLR